MADPNEYMRDEYEPQNAAEARFEAAADAVVEGDLGRLRALLDEDPELARAASPRQHQCTLLHYVAANGFEYKRQKVPANACDVAHLLFERGVVADATCEFGYGGPGTTPLIALVTSWWPAAAGLHAPLVDAFVDGGARVDGIDADNAAPIGPAERRSPLDFALAFGYQEAAQALFRRGARVDRLTQAAGLGQIVRVRELWANAPTADAINHAFVTACRHRHLNVATLLLDQGAALDTAGDQGFTALHTAAWYGHPEVFDWLLTRDAPLEVENAYGGTVLDATCWAAANAPHPGVDYLPFLERLCEAGADVSKVSPFPSGHAEVDAMLRRRGRT